jgi:hypothetical protein
MWRSFLVQRSKFDVESSTLKATRKDFPRFQAGGRMDTMRWKGITAFVGILIPSSCDGIGPPNGLAKEGNVERPT